jgi:hypothetical protein
MVKLQYVLRAPATEPPERFAARVLRDLAPRLLAAGPASLKVTLTTERPPRWSIVPCRRGRIAVISLCDAADSPECAAVWTARLKAAGAEEFAGYRVEESVPLSYARDWPDGTPTPGVGLLTLLCRKSGLGDEEFLRRWHGGHSSLSLRTHPLWNYVRNVVRDAVVPGSPWWCGIVEEQFRSADDLLDPVRFFGGPWRMVPNMIRVGLDIHGFLDLSGLESYLVTEHWLRS